MTVSVCEALIENLSEAPSFRVWNPFALWPFRKSTAQGATLS
jgi:hypothetical protein